MKPNIKTISMCAMLPFLAVTTFANAVNPNMDNAQLRNLENRVNALEQRRGAGGIINPPGRPQVREGADLFVTLDLLVWQARENGLAVGIKSSSTPSEEVIRHGQVKNLNFDWSPGVRLGIGYDLPHDGWDLSFTWLHFHGGGHRTSHAGSYHTFYPRLGSPSATPSNDPCSKTHGHWKLHLNQLDLDMGREFFVSKWLTLRPHFGLRSDWVGQRLKAKYDHVVNSQNVPQSDFTVKMKDEWWGMGLEAGLDSQWGLGYGWSIYGNICTSILYGFHQISFLDSTQSPKVTQNNTRNSYHTSHPVLDLQLGIRWDQMFCNDRFHIGIQTGWEQHIYFSQNQLMYFTDDVSKGSFVSNQGDLTLQGWTLSARFDF